MLWNWGGIRQFIAGASDDEAGKIVTPVTALFFQSVLVLFPVLDGAPAPADGQERATGAIGQGCRIEFRPKLLVPWIGQDRQLCMLRSCRNGRESRADLGDGRGVTALSLSNDLQSTSNCEGGMNLLSN